MRIHFDGANFSSTTGPNAFATRLATALFNLGHDVATDNGAAADVSLVFIERTGQPLAPVVVQRLDGIWFKPADFHTKNVGIKALYQQANAVVWQSDFDRGMTTKWWGQPRQGTVVHNGIDLRPVKQITIPRLAELRASYDRVYVASSNWHPQKRLRADVALFDHLFHSNRDVRSCLIVLGANADLALGRGPHVFFAGSVDADTYLQVYAAADWLLHLAWADHCPNVVVEALSQGTPVACSDVGGTKELVGGYGVVLKEQPYDYELYDYDNPPPIDVTQVDELPSRHDLAMTHADIDINRAAADYVALFNQLRAT